MAWGPNSSADHGSWIFRGATNTFEKTSALSGVGYDIGSRENYGAWYDQDRECVWIGAGAPVAYSQTGELRFDPATKLYTYDYPTPFSGGDSALLYHAGYLYSVGGWSNRPTVRRNLFTGAVSSYGGSPAPQFTRQTSYGLAEEESPRLTYARSGIRPNGTIWTLANDNGYWTCPLNGTWQQHTTTGDAPTTLGIVATLVEPRNVLVAWCGKTGMVVAASGTTLRQTWVLDLATLVWSKGPGLAAGDVVPTASVMCCNNLVSDGNSATLVVDVQSAKSEVWRLSWGSL